MRMQPAADDGERGQRAPDGVGAAGLHAGDGGESDKVAPFVRPILALLAALSIVLLVVAVVAPWLSVPLISSYSGWALPVDIGWGVHSDVLSYSALTALLALGCLARVLASFDWRYRWRGAPRSWQARPLTHRTLIGLASLMLALTLLFTFQFLFVDYHLATLLADQENSYLLIKLHLGYGLARQHIPLKPFLFDTAGFWDRTVVFFELAGAGPVLPTLAAISSFVAAIVAYRYRALLPPPVSPVRLASHSRMRRLWVGAGVVALVLFARAPSAMWLAEQAKAAVAKGDYQGALNQFALAQTLAPSLVDQPTFRMRRGQALYWLRYRGDADVHLYLAAQYRAAADPESAWNEDSGLLAQFPQDAVVQHDAAVSLSQLVEKYTVVAFTPPDDSADYYDPEIAVGVGSTENSLPPLDRLVNLPQGRVYAYYMRGRTYFAAHSYELAERDLNTVLQLSKDNDMQSNAYTYLALCYAHYGDYTTERILVQKAISLDKDYNNRTAREDASGLH